MLNLTGGVTTFGGSIAIASGSGTGVGIINLTGGTLDLGDLVAVLHPLVAGEVEHAAAGCTQRTADGEQDGVAEATARKRVTRAVERLRKFFEGLNKK